MRRAMPIVVILAALIAGWIPFLNKGTSELPVYTLAAERLLEQDEIYRRDDEKPFSYPPFAGVPFVPFAFLPADQNVQRSAWYLVNVAALAAIIVMLRRMTRPWQLPGRGELWFWLAVAALSVRHVLAAFQNQSNDVLVFFALTCAARALGLARGMLAGLCAGAGAAFKATPLLFAVPFAAQLNWRALVGLGIGAAVCTAIPDVLFPRVDGQLWIVAWYQIMVAGIGVGDTAAQQGVWHPGCYLNQGLSGTLYRLTTELEPALRVIDIAPVYLGEGARKAVTIVGQLLVVLTIGLAAWRRLPADAPAEQRTVHGLGIASLVACGMLLLSPMSSKAHFCTLALPAACCASVWMRTRDRLLGGMLVAVFVLGTLSTKGITGNHFGEWLLATGALTWATALFLAATARALWSVGRGVGWA